MRNHQHVRADINYTAYSRHIESGSATEAYEHRMPRRRRSNNDKGAACVALPGSADYFVFHQTNGHWVWRRMNQAHAVVQASRSGFGDYLYCTADARKHGWKGSPLRLFLPRDYQKAG